MNDLLTASNNVTFTVKSLPKKEAQRKTLVRLMQMEPEVKKGLKRLQTKRKNVDNVTYIRAGVPWTNRKRATKIVWLEVGATFTIKVTAQLVPDLKSIEAFVDAKAA